MSFIDMHMHSSISNDGEFTPRQLMEKCAQNGVKVAALSDHNSVAGIAEATYYAGENGVQLIPAIELDCHMNGVNLHVLGYGIDPAYQPYQIIEHEIETQEREASAKIMAAVKKLGIQFEEEAALALSHKGIITGEIIAEVSLADPRNSQNPLLEPYRTGGERSENPFVSFYWDFCAQGKPGYVPIRFMPLTEAVDTITASGGIAVLAHPGNNIGRDEKLLDSILGENVTGVEVYSSYHDEQTVCFYERKAKEYGYLMTAGSDYHGKTKPAIQLGGTSCHGNEEEILAGLRKHQVIN